MKILSLIFLFCTICTQTYAQNEESILIKREGNKYIFLDQKYSYSELREELKDHTEFQLVANHNINISQIGTGFYTVAAGLIISGISLGSDCESLECSGPAILIYGAIPFAFIGYKLKKSSKSKKLKSLELLNGKKYDPNIGLENTLELKLMPGSGLGLVYTF